MAKAGTTALADHLAGHPEVFIPPLKEIHFFDKNFERGPDWYRSQFSGARSERAIGDATPTYAAQDLFVERMSALLPDTRIILVLRNPIDRAYSHYWWMREAVRFETREFAEAVRDEMADPLGSRTLPQFGYLAQSKYITVFERLERFNRPESILAVVGETLRTNAAHIFPAVCRFIGVADAYQPSDFGRSINVAFARRSTRLHTLMLRTKAANWLPGAYLVDRANRVPLTYPPIDSVLRSELHEWFAPSVADLSARLGLDLTAVWSG